MYWLFGIFVLLCVFCLALGSFRRRRIIKKLRRMGFCEKVCLLGDILAPFGFRYQEGQDIIVTAEDSWQRAFGYRTLFDRTAHRFGMVFDCEAVYFYHQGRTYRLELWKGQYGVNTGGEVGLYFAEGTVAPEDFDRVSFQSVSDRDTLQIQMTLYHKGREVFCCAGRRWWLGGFCIGAFSQPEDLVLKVSVTFQDSAMAENFLESLANMGYTCQEAWQCNLTVSLTFSRPHTRQPGSTYSLPFRWIQWKNRMSCRIFGRLTGVFSSALDRILYLYFFLPRGFRRMMLHRRNRRQSRRTQRKAVVRRGI